jgi:site-specific DNA-methyltransferase (adenine-specific)
MKEIPDGSVDMILTDPPYGTTACKWDSIIPLDAMWEQLKRITKPNGAVVLFGAEPFSSLLRVSNLKGFKYDWVWDKVSVVGFANAKKTPLRNVEMILVFYSSPPTYHPQGLTRIAPKRAKNASTHTERNVKGVTGLNGGRFGEEYTQEWTNYPRQILRYSREGKTVHPTQKPVALMEYLIKTYTNEGETVLDFTMGSGTTGVACVKTGRKFIGIELDEDYFLAACKRIERETSQTTLNL